MHRVHAGYTLLARLAPDREAATRALLAGLDAQRLPFASTATTHFATVTIIPAQMYGDEQLPATLMFATSFCGPASDHVKELVAVMGDGLRDVFQYCEGFTATCTDAELEAFILEHREADTFYSGMQNLTPEDVRRHHELRAAIENYIDERPLAGRAVDIHREIQDHVRAQPELAWAQQSFALPPGTWLALHWRTLIVAAIALPFLAALVIATLVLVFDYSEPLCTAVVCGWIVVGAAVAFLGGLVLAVRHAETEQTYVSGRQPDANVRALANTQNRLVINEMTIAGSVKEGSIRPMFLRLALWIVARLAEGIPYVRAGIHIPTVATARWIPADGGRRLIFISNYTNAAEGYVRDFIDTTAGAKNINLSFGFGRGYPKTEWVVDDGAIADPNAFMYVVSENQHPTAFWYGPYHDISIDNITINRRIREGLFVTLDEHRAQAWLHLL